MKKFTAFILLILLAGIAWSQTQNDTIFCFKSNTPVTIDGQATEECWTQAGWNVIDQVWIPYNETMKEGDFEGRFKVAWDENFLYILVEVIDDSLSDDYSDPLSNWWNDDCLEIFIDEDRSKGDHERNCNAFAYHVSLSFDAVDLNSWGQGVNYKDNVEVDMVMTGENAYLWEFAIKNYDASFNLENPENSRVYLEPAKIMGIAVAYCDNDETSTRENFIGSMYMSPSSANDMYKNADHFGPMVLTLSVSSTGVSQGNYEPAIKIFPLPAQNFLSIRISSPDQHVNSISIFTLTGQLVKSESFYGNSHTLNIENLHPGNYMFTVNHGQDVNSQMILKQ